VEAPRLDINTASLAQLERIPGVGFIIAQSIVAYREVNGPFTSLDQLQEIPGITPETSDELKHMLVIQEVIKATPPTPTIPELEHAWQSIANGNISTAVDQYSYFIRQEQHLDEIINEIQEAVMIYPLDPLLYQTLGDAYLRLNRLQEAMEAYNHAEDLLK
jgi:competence ComEA-like helix-hairpin-helix protein